MRGGPASPLLLDGAMGTALLAAGLGAADLPERWILEFPERIAAVHRAQRAAGARVVLTCTFNLAGERLDGSGIDATVETLAARAVEIAREAAPDAQIAGAVGPAWLSSPDRAAWRERHGRALRALAAAGADLLWTESQWELDEARVALAEGRRAGKPVAVTFGFRGGRGALQAGSGEDALECLSAVQEDGAVAVGSNCGLLADPLEPLVAKAATRLHVPIIAKPSAGLPGAVLPPEAFAERIAALVRAGATWVGGCCGAMDEHIAAVAERMDSAR